MLGEVRTGRHECVLPTGGGGQGRYVGLIGGSRLTKTPPPQSTTDGRGGKIRERRSGQPWEVASTGGLGKPTSENCMWLRSSMTRIRPSGPNLL